MAGCYREKQGILDVSYERPFERFVNLRKDSGLTLIELMIIIVVLGIVAAVAVPKVGSLIGSSRVSATKSEMAEIKMAIVGSPQNTAGGKYVVRGFQGDVGHVPSSLQDLVTKPDSVQAYNRLTERGWNGPYIDSTGGEYLNDAWNVAYSYDPATRTIVSTGSGNTITMSF